MKRTPEGVTITLTNEQYEVLILALGFAADGAKDSRLFAAFIRLANAVNEGNPNWVPYEVEVEAPST
jgi:hypothetical protein